MEMQELKERFKSKNLQEIDLFDQSLTGADFSKADIRGAKFNNCDLIHTSFEGTKAGISNNWKITLYFITTFLGSLAGLISGYSGGLLSDLFFGNSEGLIFGIVSLILIVIFLTNIWVKGIGITLAIISELSAAALIAAMALFSDEQSQSMLAVDAQFTVLSIAGYTAGLINMAVAISISQVAHLVRLKSVLIIVSSLGLSIGILFGVSQRSGYAVALIIGLITIAIGYHTGQKAISNKQDNKYKVIQLLSKNIVTIGATTFQGANLTSANFGNANLSNVDFRNSILLRTNFRDTQGLSSSRVENTYLENSEILELVTTRNGQGKKYENFSLRGLNLENANLEGTSLLGSDLSNSSLKSSNLKGAILAKAQLYHADLEAAELTGAIIENWGISTDTSFKNVKCDYIYTRLPPEGDRDFCRKPDNQNVIFQPGDFIDFITPFIKTLDLYKAQGVDLVEVGRKFKTLDLIHHDTIDPSALAEAFHAIAEKYPDAELDILALEGHKDSKIRIQAKVANTADRSAIYQDYFETYERLKASPNVESLSLLAKLEEKDKSILQLESLLNNALQQPKFYVETYSEGDYIMSQSKGSVSISGVSGNVSGVAAAGEEQNITGAILGEVSGNVTNTINQLAESENDTSPNLKTLLNQLQIAIETENELEDDDKVEALEQLKILAEASQQPEDQGIRKAGKTAIKILKGTAAGLSDAAKLTSVFKEVLPVLSTLLPFI